MTAEPAAGPAPEPDYVVVANDEDQYSIWRADQPPPAGWRIAGTTGSKAACLEHIDQVWTDMTPRSLRRS